MRKEISDPNRSAPPNMAMASKPMVLVVGGYNTFWVDPGSDLSELDGKIRTSIIYEPANGRQPPLTPKGMREDSTSCVCLPTLMTGRRLG